jgi:hypothetical protein
MFEVLNMKPPDRSMKPPGQREHLAADLEHRRAFPLHHLGGGGQAQAVGFEGLWAHESQAGKLPKP